MSVNYVAQHHPIRRTVILIRCWLFLVIVLMALNANIATGYLLTGPLKPIPFYIVALAALVWFWGAWKSSIVISCSCLLIVGSFLRGCEVLFYATQYPLTPRLTGVSLWWFMSGTCLVMGIFSLIATSRRKAEGWIHEQRDNSPGASS